MLRDGFSEMHVLSLYSAVISGEPGVIRIWTYGLLLENECKCCWIQENNGQVWEVGTCSVSLQIEGTKAPTPFNLLEARAFLGSKLSLVTNCCIFAKKFTHQKGEIKLKSVIKKERNCHQKGKELPSERKGIVKCHLTLNWIY
jgi:hypothetical protein